MKRTILFLLPLLLCVVVLASSCCDCRKRSKLERPLVGTTWQLVQIMARDVEPADECYTILFHDDNTVSGMGDCNRFTATYNATTSRSLDIVNLGSTRRLCPNADAETEFFTLLEGVTHYEMDADMMLLLRDGMLVAILKATNPESAE